MIAKYVQLNVYKSHSVYKDEYYSLSIFLQHANVMYIKFILQCESYNIRLIKLIFLECPNILI